MRTVVFSDESVAKEMNGRFVSAWMNKRPDIKFQDGLYKDLTDDFYSKYCLGTGVGNITAVFATANGRVLNAVPGYLDAASFKAEMRFALDLNERISNANGTPREDAPELVTNAHVERTKWLGMAARFQKAAHQRLGQAGVLKIGQVHATYFDDLAPRRGG